MRAVALALPLLVVAQALLAPTALAEPPDAPDTWSQALTVARRPGPAGTVGAGDAADWYRIEHEPGEELAAWLATPSGHDLVLELRAEDGALLAEVATTQSATSQWRYAYARGAGGDAVRFGIRPVDPALGEVAAYELSPILFASVDLAVRSIEVVAGTIPRAGDAENPLWHHVRVTVENLGPARTTGGHVTIAASSGGQSHLISRHALPALEVGATATFDAGWNTLGLSGEFEVWALARALHYQSDRNELDADPTNDRAAERIVLLTEHVAQRRAMPFCVGAALPPTWGARCYAYAGAAFDGERVAVCTGGCAWWALP